MSTDPPESVASTSRSIPRSGSPSLQQATLRLGTPVQASAFPASPAAEASSSFASTPIVGPGNPPGALNNFPGGNSPPRYGTPPRFNVSGTPPRFATPIGGSSQLHSDRAPSINYGSFDSRQPFEDPEVVRRHLVNPDDNDGSDAGDSGADTPNPNTEFSSLQLQGGDITRPIYRYVEQNAPSDGGGPGRARSQSFYMPRPAPDDETEDINQIKTIGGFRRDFLRRKGLENDALGTQDNRNGFFTRNFIEFLTLHGHFAGEDLEDEEGWEEAIEDVEEGEREMGEQAALLGQQRPPAKKKHTKIATGTAGSGKAVLLLLKSFVGTGVLFLPKAYLNGGMLFSNLVLLAVSLLSFYCFVLLVRTRLKVIGGFGDIGETLYGPKMRYLILSSIVVSQIGFAAAYIVFTSENLQAFVLAVTNNTKHIDVKYFILLQCLIFLPFSMIRDMAKLSASALVADFFIVLGLVYLYYYDIFTLSTHGIADIKAFNPADWTLFIGTAIFTFEGIGLIIPIQETMKHPEKFPKVLAQVMVVITFIFLSMGALCYAAFGSNTQTVVILNLPQDSKFVNAVQFLYSLAILLSTPLQLFPAIRVMETGIFPKSGKFNWKVKWEKNLFRFAVVISTALISWGGADDLDKFVALIGSFACIPLVYIYPPMLYMRAYPGKERGRLIALIVFGAVVMVYTTVLTVVKWGDSGN
ncbi:hypothetical protein EX30DRAFT_310631 [Ascodesmis nigricans]|uniref:Amino acid transporter transmembrane domain-containing protein n=1 Tax=Ascodesmis nigricans TaxID=341454 RepID=A0A4S2MLJ6_9PEZI|nr:hypothetical protein EX30DRAFT_310631 [Ascodesmis nigricans]